MRGERTRQDKSKGPLAVPLLSITLVLREALELHVFMGTNFSTVTDMWKTLPNQMCDHIMSVLIHLVITNIDTQTHSNTTESYLTRLDSLTQATQDGK